MSCLPLWYKDLTPELRKHAETTLGETSDRKAKALVDFRRLINDQKNVYSRLDEVFLLRFLRTKKYDVQKAFKVYLNYYHFKSKQTGTFAGRLPSEFKHILDMNSIMYVPQRLQTGSHLAIYKMGAFDLQKGTIADLISTVFIISELILDCEATQVTGGVILLDLKGATISHLRQFFAFQFLSLIINLVQDCLPERLKGVHLVNEPGILYAVYRLVKPMLKKKMVERIHFHGKNTSKLYQHIPRSHLPQEYGGHLGPFDNSELAKYFYAAEDFIERNNKYGMIKE